jgi:hypothetical protein
VPRLAVAILAIVLVLSLASAAPAPREADKPALYIPTKVGDKRVLALVGSENEWTEVVSKVENKEGMKSITIESFWKFRSTEQYSLTEKGLFLVSFGDFRYSEPWCIVKAPYRAGEKWETDFTEFGTRSQSTYTNGDVEWVEVPAGKFKALRVETEHQGKTPPTTTTIWYTSGVGYVKKVGRNGDGKEEFVVVLKSFTPGKD